MFIVDNPEGSENEEEEERSEKDDDDDDDDDHVTHNNRSLLFSVGSENEDDDDDDDEEEEEEDEDEGAYDDMHRHVMSGGFSHHGQGSANGFNIGMYIYVCLSVALSHSLSRCVYIYIHGRTDIVLCCIRGIYVCMYVRCVQGQGHSRALSALSAAMKTPPPPLSLVNSVRDRRMMMIIIKPNIYYIIL